MLSYENVRQALARQKLITILDTDPICSQTMAGYFYGHGICLLEMKIACSEAEASAERIRVLKQKFPSLKICAGLLSTSDALDAAINAGAAFGCAPNCNVLEKAIEKEFPLIPGVNTEAQAESALKIMQDSGHGWNILKILSCAGRLDEVRELTKKLSEKGTVFILSGDMRNEIANEYLELPGVIALDGTRLWPPNVRRP